MAYLTVISATAVPGKAQEAIEKTQAVADHANQNYSGSVRLLASMDGPNDRYHWVQENESLSDWETDQEEWANDPVGQEWSAVVPEYWKDLVVHRYKIL